MSLKLNSSGGGSVTLQEPTTASNVTLNLPAADGTVVYENASGNVGIGTSSPSSRLDIAGGILTTRGGEIRANNTGSAATLSLTGGNAFAGGSGAAIAIRGTSVGYNNGGMEFYYGNGTITVEAARIDSSGNLLVGTTSNSNGARFAVSAAWPQTPSVMYCDRGAGQTAIAFFNSGSQVGRIDTTSSATSYVTSSDYRLKHDIQPMSGALSKVAQLKPVTYKWNLDDSESQGFIAHELQAVVPDCVTGEKDAVDADGNPVYQGIDTSFLVATLTAAIQELKAEVDSLRAQVEAQ